MMGGVDVSDAYLVTYHSTRKRLKKYYQNHFCHLIDICCLNSNLLYKQTESKITMLEFQYRLTENLISKADSQRLAHRLGYMHLIIKFTLLLQPPSRTHFSSVLNATRLASIVKQGIAVKTARSLYLRHPVSNSAIDGQLLSE
jgi:hypothetical protein